MGISTSLGGGFAMPVPRSIVGVMIGVAVCARMLCGSAAFGCAYRREVNDDLLERHYRQAGRRLRRCQARDLLLQIRSYCNYASLPMEMRPEYFDRAVKAYFATVLGEESDAKWKGQNRRGGPRWGLDKAQSNA
jgi:hypothetical protein